MWIKGEMYFDNVNIVFIFLLYFFHHWSVDCLKLIRLSVPKYKLRGERAELECLYELEGDTLYAVKWYKENEEFYKYVPKFNPPQMSYEVEGITVDHYMSNNTKVALKSVNLKSSGVYKCEVSAEGPSFASAQKESRMDVLFLPAHGPRITGEQKQYMIGDKLNLTCTSAKSYPAPALHWYINEVQVSEREGIIRHPRTVHPRGLVTAALSLSMTVMPHHFKNGIMKLRCVASLSPVLWQGVRESIVQSNSPLLDNREASFLVKGGGVKMGGNLALFSLCVFAPVFLWT